MTDRKKTPSYHQNIKDSEHDTMFLASVLRGDVGRRQPSSQASLEAMRQATGQLADRLTAVVACQMMAKAKAVANASGRERVPIAAALRHVEVLCEKGRKTQEKLEMRRALIEIDDKENDHRGKKDGLMRKIAEFQATNAKLASTNRANHHQIAKGSEKIAEERFEMKKIRDVITNSKGEEIILTCPITEKIRKPTKKRIGNNVVLGEQNPITINAHQKSKNVNTKNKLNDEALVNQDKKRKVKDCKTNIIRDSDNMRVYANYSGKKVKIDRKNSDGDKKFQVADNHFNRNNEDDPLPVKMKKQLDTNRNYDHSEDSKSSQLSEETNEISEICLNPDELVKEDQLEENKKKLRPKKVYLNYLEDFLVSKAKKLVYHNFDDPTQDTRVLASKLAEEVDLILKHERKLIIQNTPQRPTTDNKRGSVMGTKLKGLKSQNDTSAKKTNQEALRSLQMDQRDTMAPPFVPVKSSLADMVKRGMAERVHERAKLPADIVTDMREQLLSAYHEEVERYRLEDEHELAERIRIQKEKEDAEVKMRAEIEAENKKRQDKEKIMKLKSKALAEEKEKEALLKGLDMPIILETLKKLSELQIPTVDELEGIQTLQAKGEKYERDSIEQKKRGCKQPYVR